DQAWEKRETNSLPPQTGATLALDNLQTKRLCVVLDKVWLSSPSDCSHSLIVCRKMFPGCKECSLRKRLLNCFKQASYVLELDDLIRLAKNKPHYFTKK